MEFVDLSFGLSYCIVPFFFFCVEMEGDVVPLLIYLSMVSSLNGFISLADDCLCFAFVFCPIFFFWREYG